MLFNKYCLSHAFLSKYVFFKLINYFIINLNRGSKKWWDSSTSRKPLTSQKCWTKFYILGNGWPLGDPFLWRNKVLSKVVLSGAIKRLPMEDWTCFVSIRAPECPLHSQGVCPGIGHSNSVVCYSFCWAVFLLSFNYKLFITSLSPFKC